MAVINLEQLCDDFIVYIEKTRNFSPPTIRSYKYVLNSFMPVFEDLDIQQITIVEIDDYIARHIEKRGLCVASGNMVRSVLRAFFLYCDRYRDIRLRFDPSMIRAAKSARPKVRHIDVDEAKLIILNLQSPQDKLMYATMFATGMRIGELVGLQVEDLQEDEITVRGKGLKDRVIPIDPGLKRALQNHIYKNNLRTGPVFRIQIDRSYGASGYTVSGVRKRWQRQLQPKGLYVKPHAARHGIATTLLHDGMDIRTLQTFLGHSHIGTTMLYTHVTDTHLRESVAKHFPADFNANKLVSA